MSTSRSVACVRVVLTAEIAETAENGRKRNSAIKIMIMIMIGKLRADRYSTVWHGRTCPAVGTIENCWMSQPEHRSSTSRITIAIRITIRIMITIRTQRLREARACERSAAHATSL